jgi:hypothetical protein
VWPGDLAVGDNASPADLACIVVIEGALTIGPSPGLSTPLPLPRLREVHGALTIAGNPALTALDGLEALERIGGILHISENDALTDVSALGNLVAVSDVEFFDDPLLANLSLFAPSVAFTAGESGVVRLGVAGLPALVDLDGLAHVDDVTVTGRLLIDLDRDAALADVSGVAGFFPEGAATSLALRELPALTSIELAGVASIGELVAIDVPALASLDGLADLTTADRVEFVGAATLTSMTGLDQLAVVTDTLSLGGCAGQLEPVLPSGISHLDGLGGLTAVGWLEITGQPQLATLAGLSSTAIVGALTIRNNAVLPNDDALDYLAAVMPPDGNSICGNGGEPACEIHDCPGVD